MRIFRITAAVLLLALAPAWTPISAQDTTSRAPEEAFLALEQHDWGDARAPLYAIERYIGFASGDERLRRAVAGRLASILAAPSTPQAARIFICKQLAVVGSDFEVPLLATLLDTPETVDCALLALEAIPGEASGGVLRDALGRLEGNALAGTALALGRRGDAAATGSLTKLLSAEDAGVACAAARALGMLGTPEAARALASATVPAGFLPMAAEAQLRCAERLVAVGDIDPAEWIYARFWSMADAPSLRVAGLTGLVAMRKGEVLWEAIADADPLVQATAIRLTRALPNRSDTARLAERLAKLDPRGQELLIAALAERGDPTARPVVAALLSSENDSVRLAAIKALGPLGATDDAIALARLASAGKGATREAARQSLARLEDPDADAALRDALASEADAGARAEIALALAARGDSGAVAALLSATRDQDKPVASAAWDALASLAGPCDAKQIVEALLHGSARRNSQEAEKAAAAVLRKIENPDERVALLLPEIERAGVKAKASFLAVLGACGGGDKALEAVRAGLGDANIEVRDTAVRALADWPEPQAAGVLLELAERSESASHRGLALRGYLRLVPSAPEEERLDMIARAKPLAAMPEDKKQLLMTLASIPTVPALRLVDSMLDDAEVREEAVLAALMIARPIADRETVAAAMEHVLKVAQTEETKKDAKNLLNMAQGLVECLEPTPYGSEAIDARRKEIQAEAPDGAQLIAYVDCGVQAESQQEPIRLRMISGMAYQWAGAQGVAPGPFGTIAYAAHSLEVEASGLNPAKQYALGLSWWDFDANGRRQSVRLAGDQAGQALVPATALPAYSGAESLPQQLRVALAPESFASGSVRFSILAEGDANVVLSEAWLLESDAPIPAPRASARVLFVTGVDYPGHKWRETTPALRKLLEADPRIELFVAEDPHVLESASLLERYDALVLHFMNWEVPAPGPEARENLVRFVEAGKGLVLTHFTCGAFQDWPEFGSLVGRVWDPKLRGHDPHGAFRVDILKPEHPALAGLESFETVDELYTCLAGETPIDVLATARSKVDGKDYPMAFVLEPGKGRVFHSPLGHDVEAFAGAPEVGDLFRRGLAWAARLTPPAQAAK